MASVPPKYQPTTRIIDSKQRLQELYCEQDMTIRAVANHPQVEVSTTRIYTALDEYDLLCCRADSERGRDPPSTDESVDWDEFIKNC